MQEANPKFKSEGIGLAAISYDSQEILADFSKRHSITFPLLADPKSEILTRYGVVDTGAKGMTTGMAHPGYIFVTPDGKFSESFFESAYTDRYTANNLMLKLFPDLVEGSGRELPAPQIGLALAQSDRIVAPGSRITLTAKISLPADTHVYAPGVTGYKPIQLTVEPIAEARLASSRYPRAATLFLPAIKETVPVFEGNFPIEQDVIIASDGAFIKSLGKGRKVKLNGTLKYQACDQTVCYQPQSIPLEWEVQVGALDFDRSPAAIQHK